MSAAVVIPVKSFAAAKRRLAPALSAPARAELAREMATLVVAAAGPLPVTVVCDDPEVRAWATDLGVTALWTPGLGLDGAVSAGIAAAGGDGADAVLVAHSDLPLARDLSGLLVGHTTEHVTLVPDRWADGTNVVIVAPGAGFRPAYGAGSFARHRAEARRCGLRPRIVTDVRLGWDVDVPADLDLPTDAQLARLGGPGPRP